MTINRSSCLNDQNYRGNANILRTARRLVNMPINYFQFNAYVEWVERSATHSTKNRIFETCKQRVLASL